MASFSKVLLDLCDINTKPTSGKQRPDLSQHKRLKVFHPILGLSQQTQSQPLNEDETRYISGGTLE